MAHETENIYSLSIYSLLTSDLGCNEEEEECKGDELYPPGMRCIQGNINGMSCTIFFKCSAKEKGLFIKR